MELAEREMEKNTANWLFCFGRDIDMMTNVMAKMHGKTQINTFQERNKTIKRKDETRLLRFCGHATLFYFYLNRNFNNFEEKKQA